MTMTTMTMTTMTMTVSAWQQLLTIVAVLDWNQ
jgi:hypothetical protein